MVYQNWISRSFLPLLMVENHTFTTFDAGNSNNIPWSLRRSMSLRTSGRWPWNSCKKMASFGRNQGDLKLTVGLLGYIYTNYIYILYIYICTKTQYTYIYIYILMSFTLCKLWYPGWTTGIFMEYINGILVNSLWKSSVACWTKITHV